MRLSVAARRTPSLARNGMPDLEKMALPKAARAF